MPTIAELAAAQPGTPIVGLQGYISKVYPPESFGKGHKQHVFISDNTGEMLLRVMDGPELAAGMQIQISAKPKEVTIRGQKTTEWDGAYTDVYDGKMRFDCKARCLMILSGGQPPAPAQPAWGVPPTPPPAPALAPGGPLGPAYGQAQAAPLPGSYQPQAGQPGAFPAQPGRRRDREWVAGAGLPPVTDAQTAAVRSTYQAYVDHGMAAPLSTLPTPPPAPAWQPKPKMTVDEVRVFLLAQFVEFTEALGREWAAGSVPASGIPTPLAQLPPEVVAGAMAWATSILISYQRGDVVAEAAAPTATSEPQAPAGPEAGTSEDTSIPF